MRKDRRPPLDERDEAPPGEDERLRRCRAGDRASCEELLRAHRTRVAAQLHRLLGEPEEALADRVQEVFVAALGAVPGRRADPPLATRLQRAIGRVALERLRARGRTPRAPQAKGLGAEAGAPTSDGGSGATARVHRALDELPPRQRVALVLHDVEGLDARTVSDVVGLPTLVTRAGIRRARRVLARQIEPGALLLLRDEPLPAVAWDVVGTRIYWTISSAVRREERVAAQRERRRSRSAPLLVGTSVAIVLAGLVAVGLRAFKPVPFAAPSTAPPGAVAVDLAERGVAAPAAAVGVVTFLQGAARIDGRPLFVRDRLVPGAHLQVAAGRLGAQLGEDLALLVSAGTRVRIVALDEERLELEVEGSVSVALPPANRAPLLVVRAGARRVEARAAVLRVTTGPDLVVDVARGRALVATEGGTVDVPAGSREVVAAGAVPPSPPRRLPEGAGETLVAELEATLVPGRADAAGAAAIVQIAGPPGAEAAVDGIARGAAPLTLRVPAGRHLVEVAGEARWLVARDGETIVARPPDGVADTARVEQLRAQLAAHREALLACLAAVTPSVPEATPVVPGATPSTAAAKPSVPAGALSLPTAIASQGPAAATATAAVAPANAPSAPAASSPAPMHGAVAPAPDGPQSRALELELGVEPDGALAYARPVRGLADGAAERCVLGVVRARFVFAPGGRARVTATLPF